MKMIIETFVTIIFLSIAVVLSAQVIGSQVSINQANDFHINAVQAIEESNFDNDVIESCISQAEELGYVLSVEVNKEEVLQCAECNAVWELEEGTVCEVCGSENSFVSDIKNNGLVELDYVVEVAMLGISQSGRLEANAR